MKATDFINILYIIFSIGVYQLVGIEITLVMILAMINVKMMEINVRLKIIKNKNIK